MKSNVYTLGELIEKYESLTEEQQKLVKPKGKNDHFFFEYIEDNEELLKVLSNIPEAKVEFSKAAIGYSFELKDGSILTIGKSNKKDNIWVKHFPFINEEV
jgi:predicted RNA-binding protein with EMAP domain